MDWLFFTATTIATTVARTITTAAQSKPPLVVISGSPIKLTPLSRGGAALTGAQTNSSSTGNITCTLVHVQPFTNKQHIAPKTGSSPSKQTIPVQLQKLVPISVATSSLTKVQTGTAPQFTIAAPAGSVSGMRHIAPKVNLVSAVPTGQAVQLTTPTVQVRNIAPAVEKTAQVPQQVGHIYLVNEKVVVWVTMTEYIKSLLKQLYCAFIKVMVHI